MAARITVVGAGVLGLSCAVRLAEHGYDVNVLARDLPAETTSAALGGLWLPALARPAAEPTSRPAAMVARWAGTTLVELLAIAADPDTATGVRPTAGHLLHARPVPPPQWAASVPGLVSLQAQADPAPGYPFGYRVTLPVVDTPTYLSYLRQRLAGSGGTLTRLPLPALPPRGLVINCTGLSARALVPDPSVQPERGQVVLMSDPGLDQWWCDAESDDQLMYVLPRGRDVVVGGTVEAGRWDTTPDPRIAERLVERARAAVPRLSSARVLGHRVGLRPARPSVRLEVEHRPGDDDPDHAVVHCYGHGCSGLTLSWGCAEDVVAAVTSLAAR
jgi:D-amino-acid oxidase